MVLHNEIIHATMGVNKQWTFNNFKVMLLVKFLFVFEGFLVCLRWQWIVGSLGKTLHAYTPKTRSSDLPV